jgi:hypothetical protein
MKIRKLSAWAILTSMLLGTFLEAQTTNSPAPPASARKPAQKSTSTDWGAQAQKYQSLLNDVDIASDPDVKHAIYLKWIDATCQSKRAMVQQAVGGSDTSLAASVYSACAKRLQAEESNGTTTVAAGSSGNSASASGTPPVNTPPNVTLPQGCASLPQINFTTNTPLAFPPPVTEAWNPDSTWVELNANSSGGEISTKSTVWLGYINRLRYNVTLGGVVTPIAAPTIPNSIFPTATPAPTSKPDAATKPAKAGPLHGPQAVFDSFTDCYQKISTTVVTFQSQLGNEELLLNDARDRIENHVESLQPIVNTVEEARAAADRSVLPATEIPAFPIGDVIQLRGLLTDFISKYGEFAKWASADSWNASEYGRVSTGAASTAQALDKYLVSPSTSGSTSNTNASAPTNANTNTGTSTANSGNGNSGAGSGATSGPNAAAPVATGQAGNKKKPKSKDKNSNTGQSGTSNAASAAGPNGSGAGTGSGAASGAATGGGQGSAGTGTSNGTTQQAAGPSALAVGSQEVKYYEANREYINRWSATFRTVAVAPASYFVATYKPQCGGWFGQGTSTQMQLTIVDATNPGQNSTPKNLDKVVCQSALTVTNGLGLSFIPDRTPAFVPSTNSGTNGTPVLGYSSTARVRPAYAVQVNAALWSPKESNFEFHWSLGAMLTAATGGATTDIITGPSFSFKKRAFFISPVFDLGQRTVFQHGFYVGEPQGVLTSPPTQQTWKPGFGLTITFPLSPGSNTTNSSNSNGNSGSTTGGTNSNKGNKGNSNSGSNSGSGGTTPNQ